MEADQAPPAQSSPKAKEGVWWEPGWFDKEGVWWEPGWFDKEGACQPELGRCCWVQ